MSKTRKLVLILAVLLMSSLALAHHNVTNRYVLEQQHTVEGILREVKIGNPHSYLYVQLPDEGNEPNKVMVEWGAAKSLAGNYGIGRSTLITGQQIRVTGYLSINPEQFMMWPMVILTEFDLNYDRVECIAFQRAGQKCKVLTDHPPLWPVFNSDYLPIQTIDSTGN